MAGEILVGAGTEDQAQMLLEHPDLAAELRGRLEACGLELVVGPKPLAVLITEKNGLSELSQAALAICAIGLKEEPGARRRPRITIDELGERLGGSYSSAFIRRAVLGPLSSRGLIKIVKPEQRASEAYIVSGPALAAIDRQAILARLESSNVA